MKEIEIIEWFINLSGVFGHDSFFTKELWRDVKGFKNEDKAEIIAAFLHYWTHNKFRYFTIPVGCSWCGETNEKLYNSYIKTYKPVFDAYKEWQIKQR